MNAAQNVPAQRCYSDSSALMSPLRARQSKAIKTQIQDANHDSDDRQKQGRNIGIDERIQVVQKKTSLIWHDSSP